MRVSVYFGPLELLGERTVGVTWKGGRWSGHAEKLIIHFSISGSDGSLSEAADNLKPR